MESVCWMVDVVLWKERGKALESEWQHGAQTTHWKADRETSKALIVSRKHSSR